VQIKYAPNNESEYQHNYIPHPATFFNALTNDTSGNMFNWM